ncbi:MAG: ABC transporter ATP-binding protein [Xanthomonadales bacterium]|nr:ABC transporter ATP-binding protein [Gammaproteobacteria bacterium]NNE04302.1 ABC transporter ATP-binding protein [Xanthomonadales bacterium]NNL95968.1 ABC transporter ATP-binding protein [Xanthomonadales bacterium]
MLELFDIHKSFHDGENELEVLRGVNLSLPAGDSIALVGVSGSGKSTLLQIAAGLESPDRGDVRFLGDSLQDMDERALARLRRSQLGFVFQGFNLLPGLNVRDNVLFQRRLNRMQGASDWVDELVDGLRLAALWQRPVEVLSGGQQQRVAIARALAHRPQLVFADEPTGNLHDTLSRQVMGLLIRLVEEAQSALLLVTHNQEMARFAHRRVRLSKGLVHAVPDELPEDRSRT